MDISDRDQRIDITSATRVRSASGSVSVSSATVASVWANVRQLHGSLSRGDGYEVAKQKAMFTIAYRDDIKSEYTIAWNGQEWEIETVKELNKKHLIEIRAALRE